MELIETYIEMLTTSIDEQGVYPMPAITRAGEALTFMSYACEQQQMIPDLLDRTTMAGLDEYLFGADSYTRDGQGTELDSAVIIFHVQREGESQIGVFEYSYNAGAPITRPVSWQNAWWSAVYAPLLSALDTTIKGL